MDTPAPEGELWDWHGQHCLSGATHSALRALGGSLHPPFHQPPPRPPSLVPTAVSRGHLLNELLVLKTLMASVLLGNLNPDGPMTETWWLPRGQVRVSLTILSGGGFADLLSVTGVGILLPSGPSMAHHLPHLEM